LLPAPSSPEGAFFSVVLVLYSARVYTENVCTGEKSRGWMYGRKKNQQNYKQVTVQFNLYDAFSQPGRQNEEQ
jgi:hypothetical protein